MKILTQCNLALIVSELLSGKTIVFPTETSYGLGCDATNQSAVDKIFEIKGRERTKSLLVVVPEVAMAKKYLQWNDLLEKISTKYWPGPLTVVSEARPGGLAHGVVAVDGTVAIRVSSYPFLKSITEKVGRPVVATSANLSGKGEIYSGAGFAEEMSGRSILPDYILDLGIIPQKPPSTIVKVLDDQFEVLRHGEVVVRL